MSLEEYNKYFQILELESDASFSEVRTSYLRLKALYSNDSIVTSAIMYELHEDNRKEIIGQIEEAYAALIEFFKNKENESSCKEKEKPAFAVEEIEKYSADIMTFSGPVLRQIREEFGVELKDISNFTRIRRQYFEDIELEKFNALPTDVYLRGYVVEYARYFSLDATKVADDYMSRYKAWKTETKDKS